MNLDAARARQAVAAQEHSPVTLAVLRLDQTIIDHPAFPRLVKAVAATYAALPPARWWHWWDAIPIPVPPAQRAMRLAALIETDLRMDPALNVAGCAYGLAREYVRNGVLPAPAVQ